MKPKKQYTISTLVFDSLDEVREQLSEWDHLDSIRQRTKVFEVVKEIKWKRGGIVVEGEKCEIS